MRETQEELDLDVRQCIYSPIARLTPHEHQTSAFMWVYLIKSNDVPAYNTDDFFESYWLTPDEFFAKIEQGDKAKGDLFPILRAIKDLL